MVMTFLAVLFLINGKNAVIVFATPTTFTINPSTSSISKNSTSFSLYDQSVHFLQTENFELNREVYNVQISKTHAMRFRKHKSSIIDQIIKTAAPDICCVCGSFLQGCEIGDIGFEDGCVCDFIFG